MIKLKQATATRGDCTAGYSVELSKEYTIKEFIDEVLKSNEWGAIGIYDENQSWFEKGNPYCEYKRGELISKLPDEFLDKPIKKVDADGGWSLMDYKIHI